MQFPVDDDTLAAWFTLLGLTDAQKAEVLAEIEECLRLGYDNVPQHLRQRSLQDMVTDTPIDDFAVMFLTAGLEMAGHPLTARAVLLHALGNSD